MSHVVEVVQRWLVRFFLVLGVIFFCLLLAGGYFYLADPFNLKPLLSDALNPNQLTDMVPAGDGVDTNPTLTESQEAALESFGIDPASLPSEVTPEQEACFIERLGQARVDEIVAGDTPSVTEFFRARDCVSVSGEQ